MQIVLGRFVTDCSTFCRSLVVVLYKGLCSALTLLRHCFFPLLRFHCPLYGWLSQLQQQHPEHCLNTTAHLIHTYNYHRCLLAASPQQGHIPTINTIANMVTSKFIEILDGSDAPFSHENVSLEHVLDDSRHRSASASSVSSTSSTGSARSADTTSTKQQNRLSMRSLTIRKRSAK